MALTEAWSRTRSTDEVMAVLSGAGLPCGRYRHLADLADDAQLRHRAMLTEVVDGAGPLTAPNSPFLFSATHAAVKPEVARLGQHNREVLEDELTLDADTIASLRAAGVFGRET